MDVKILLGAAAVIVVAVFLLNKPVQETAPEDFDTIAARYRAAASGAKSWKAVINGSLRIVDENVDFRIPLNGLVMTDGKNSYSKTSIEGPDFAGGENAAEVYILDGTAYVKNGSSFRKSEVGYSLDAVMPKVTGLAGEEGGNYILSSEMQVKDIRDLFSGMILAPAGEEETVRGSMLLRVWVDKKTCLPAKIWKRGELTGDDNSTSKVIVETTTTYDYNSAVNIEIPS